MSNAKYLDYTGLAHFLEKLDERFAPIQAIVFQSTVNDIASLPALNTQKTGYMYNVKTGGITTADFVEGAGHLIADGENVVAVELLTGTYTIQTLAADADPKALGLYEQVDVYTLSTDTTVDSTKTYYQANGTVPETYSAVTPIGTENPSTEGWYEKSVGYQLTEDRLPQSGKDYYKAETVKKWDALGGLFDLEGRYLEFGDTFPQGPATRMVNGRTFLFMGENQYVYEHVDTPTGRPSEEGYYEVTFSAVSDSSIYYNPKQQDLYEETAASSGIYALSEDIEVDSTKSYFIVNTATASTDTTVNPSKEYYTKADQYKKGGIYEYNATAEDWEIQSTGGSDMIPISNSEIDELFI